MKANTNTNNNSDKRHHKSYIHPRTSLPLLAVGCFALMGGHAAIAATIFTGAVDSTWEDAGNWSEGLPDAADDVNFDTAATLTSTSTIRRLLLDGAGDILTINAGGDLTGAASKGFINTSAQLIVNNGGSYTRAGILDIRNGGGGITINDGGSFDLGTLRAADGTFAISGSTADVTIGTLRTVDPATVDGNNDTFTANNANLSLSNATLNITNLMEWDGASAVSIGAGSTLNLAGSGSHLITDGVVTSAGGVVEASGSGTQTLGFAISGDGSVEQNGTGATTLNVANGHTGGTTLSSGTLVLGDAAAAGTGTLTLSGGTLNGATSTTTYANDIVVTDATSTAIFATSTGENKYTGAVSGSGTLNFGGTGSGQGTGVVRIYDLDNFTGTIHHAAGSADLFMEPGSQTETTTAKIFTSGATNGKSIRFRGGWEIGELSGTGGRILGWSNETLTINQSTTTTYSGHISDNGTRVFSIAKDGSGSLTLDFANTYTGGTTLNAGTLVLGDAAAAGTGALTLAGGTLEVAADIGNDISATGSTTMVNNTGTLSLSNDGSVTGTGTLAFSVANETRFFSDLSGFSGTVSHDNDTGGQLRLWNQVEDLSGTKIVTSGGTSNGGLQFIGNNNHTIGELSGTGGIINMRGSSGLTLTIDQSTDTTYSGLLQDGDATRIGSLVKDGSGTLTFDGANTYTGSTTVSGGTLALATGYTHSGGGAYTVEGGTLKIADGVNIGSAMTIGLGGVISPGNSPGTANTGAQTWNDGGSYIWEINASDIDGGGTKGTDPGWDWLDITGTLDLANLSAGGFTIDIDSLTASNVAGDAVGFDTWTKGNPGDVDYSFIIASASGGITDFSADKFSFDSSGFTNGPSWDWQIKLSGGDLVLEAYAVPEPSSTALLGLGGLALALRRRR